MEHISTQLPEVVNRLALTKSLSALLLNLLPEERQILEVKYKSPQFGNMDQEEIDLWADALLLKIHVITGWTIPEKTVLFVFTDQFKKKILESYSRCNPDEIEYAFRTEGTIVKDWGKSMNLSLIDEVMIPYMKKRFEVGILEEQQKVKQLEAPKENLTDKTMLDWWQDVSARVRAGTLKADFVPVMLYEWKDKHGEIKKSGLDKRVFLKAALGNINDAKRLMIYEIMKNENAAGS